MTQPAVPSPLACTLRIRVQPKAAKSQVVGFRDDVLRLRVTAPPEGGKANAAVVALVAESLDIPPSSVNVVKGRTSRDKVLRVASLTIDEVKERLDAAG